MKKFQKKYKKLIINKLTKVIAKSSLINIVNLREDQILSRNLNQNYPSEKLKIQKRIIMFQTMTSQNRKFLNQKMSSLVEFNLL